MKFSACITLLTLIHVSLFSQKYTLQVNGGYGSGQYAAGEMVHVWAGEWPLTETFSHWTGDTAFLEYPDEWHDRFAMPAQDLEISAVTQPLGTDSLMYFQFEFIPGKYIQKPVYTYFPKGGPPPALVWLWHGTGGSADNWIYKDLHMRLFCNYLVANGLALVVTESDESTLGKDLNGDGAIRYDYTLDSLENRDVANVRAIRDTFLQRGWLLPQTPLIADGFSAGGAFSLNLASQLGWKAAVSHNNPGGSFLVENTSTPFLMSMTTNDMHPDVGQAGNIQAYDNYQYLKSKGNCTDLHFLLEEPFYPERFYRIPGLAKSDADAIVNELVQNGCIGPNKYLSKTPNEIEASVASQPGKWPALLSQPPQIRDYVKDELSVTYAGHKFHHDFMARELRFIRNACAPVTAVEEPSGETAFLVFPNPARHEIRILDHSGPFCVYDLQGRLHLSGTVTAGIVDISSLACGMYILEMRQAGGAAAWSRFIKQ